MIGLFIFFGVSFKFFKNLKEVGLIDLDVYVFVLGVKGE